jgi:hypothetical protein
MNYTKEQTEMLILMYQENPNLETVKLLAQKLDKSTKSIIGKLSREGVYKRAAYKNKMGEAPLTKLEICANISEYMGVELENLPSLDKAPKETLKQVELATGVMRKELTAGKEELLRLKSTIVTMELEITKMESAVRKLKYGSCYGKVKS